MLEPGGSARRTAAAALACFAAIAAAVAAGVTSSFDAWGAAVVRRVASPAADALALQATSLASGPVTLSLAVAAAAGALAAGARRLAAVAAASWLTSVLCAQLLKALSGRARPSFPYTIAALSSPAFPSGHAMNAVIVWGVIALAVGSRFPAARRAAVAIAAGVALLAGLSRVYLGVHYPTDVLGGWAAGVAILALLASAVAPGGRPPPPPRPQPAAPRGAAARDR